MRCCATAATAAKDKAEEAVDPHKPRTDTLRRKDNTPYPEPQSQIALGSMPALTSRTPCSVLLPPERVGEVRRYVLRQGAEVLGHIFWDRRLRIQAMASGLQLLLADGKLKGHGFQHFFGVGIILLHGDFKRLQIPLLLKCNANPNLSILCSDMQRPSASWFLVWAGN